jgi:hypothetical protein
MTQNLEVGIAMRDGFDRLTHRARGRQFGLLARMDSGEPGRGAVRGVKTIEP